jgi:hypothetical protein
MKPTQAFKTASSTLSTASTAVNSPSSAFAFVTSSFFDKPLNSTTTDESEIWERSGGSPMKESTEVVVEPNPKPLIAGDVPNEGLPNAPLPPRTGVLFLLLIVGTSGMWFVEMSRPETMTQVKLNPTTCVLVWLHKRGALNRYWKTESHDLYGDVRQQILEGFGLTGMRFFKNQNMGLMASRCSEGSS